MTALTSPRNSMDSSAQRPTFESVPSTSSPDPDDEEQEVLIDERDAAPASIAAPGSPSLSISTPTALPRAQHQRSAHDPDSPTQHKRAATPVGDENTANSLFGVQRRRSRGFGDTDDEGEEAERGTVRIIQ